MKRFGVASALTGMLISGACAGGRAGAVPAAGAAVAGPKPQAATIAAVVSAGGGSANFKATTLIGVLAGSNAGAAVAAVVKRRGAGEVKQFVAVFDFAIADALRELQAGNAVLPVPTAEVSGKALVGELYAAGVDSRTGKYTAPYMLDRLLTHRLNARIMRDIDSRFGRQAAAAFQRTLQQVVERIRTPDGSDYDEKA